MDGSFRFDGFTFVQIASKNAARPYRVRCIETGDEKDSSISHDDAASLLTAIYQFSQMVGVRETL